MVGQTDGLVRQVDNHISHAVLLKLTDDLEVVGDGQLPVAAFCTLQELLGQEGFRGDAFTGANEALTLLCEAHCKHKMVLWLCLCNSN